MNEWERKVLELLAHVNQFEDECKHLNAPLAVPGSVYKHLGRLRDDVAKWGIKNIRAAKEAKGGE